MTKDEGRKLQNALNDYVDAHPKLGHTKVIVDGEPGALTWKLLHTVKYELGYSLDNAKIKAVGDDFYHRVRHPNRAHEAWGATKLAVKNGKKRRAKQRRWWARNRLRAFLHPGVGTFDGKPVAKCFIPVLQWCREHGWPGVLVSGWRSGPYSEHLCYGMCGRPSCPGRCAGRATNHTGTGPERFAGDVSAYAIFREVVKNCPILPHVHNSLPNDLVHFSPSGN